MNVIFRTLDGLECLHDIPISLFRLPYIKRALRLPPIESPFFVKEKEEEFIKIRTYKCIGKREDNTLIYQEMEE